MANPLNMGTLVGRVSQEIKAFENADGSKVLLINLAVDNNFVSGAERKAKTQFIPVRAFLPKSVNGNGSWDRVGKGDLIAISTRIECEPYEKNGETVYPSPTIAVDGFPQFLESKSVTESRAARNAVAETPAAEETPEQELARLRAQLSDAEATSPFAAAATV